MQLGQLKEKLKSRNLKFILCVGAIIGCILIAYTMDAKRIHREAGVVKFEGGILKKGSINEITFDKDYEIKESDLIEIKERLTVDKEKVVRIYQEDSERGILMRSDEVFLVGYVNEHGYIVGGEEALIDGDKIIYPYEAPEVSDDNTIDEEIDSSSEEVFVEDEKSYTDEVKQAAYSIISGELTSKITNTTLDSLQINENLGTDSEEDVVVLANLSWSTKNLEKTTREMLEMYSDHLAATLSSSLAEGSEIALFWEADYTGLNIKHSYYIKNGNAYKQ